eukprot:COSAG01_NODE_3315_length_6276_cov_6.370083_1_plen_417_part_00
MLTSWSLCVQLYGADLHAKFSACSHFLDRWQRAATFPLRMLGLCVAAPSPAAGGSPARKRRRSVAPPAAVSPSASSSSEEEDPQVDVFEYVSYSQVTMTQDLGAVLRFDPPAPVQEEAEAEGEAQQTGETAVREGVRKGEKEEEQEEEEEEEEEETFTHAEEVTIEEGVANTSSAAKGAVITPANAAEWWLEDGIFGGGAEGCCTEGGGAARAGGGGTGQRTLSRLLGCGAHPAAGLRCVRGARGRRARWCHSEKAATARQGTAHRPAAGIVGAEESHHIGTGAIWRWRSIMHRGSSSSSRQQRAAADTSAANDAAAVVTEGVRWSRLSGAPWCCRHRGERGEGAYPRALSFWHRRSSREPLACAARGDGCRGGGRDNLGGSDGSRRAQLRWCPVGHGSHSVDNQPRTVPVPPGPS